MEIFSELSNNRNTTSINTNANNLLKKQQSSNENLNTLLEQSLNDSQTAPVQLETTKKNYVVFTKGQPYYDNIIEQDLENKAEEMGQILATNFNEEITNANIMNSYYDTELTNSSHTKELYLVYLEKNQQLQKEIKGHHSDVLTNDRKTYYETQAIEDLNYWHTFFWYVYYFFVMPIFTFVLVTSSSYRWLFKIPIEILVVTYPYYIDFILRKIYGFFHFIWIRLPKNVYNNL